MKQIFFNVTTSAGNFYCEEVENIVEFFSRIAPNAEISFGCSIDEFAEGNSKIILIVS